ncbi:MAG: nucleoside triphosphate pyrophosphohydrolase [Gammaproteobacteria bacterium]
MSQIGSQSIESLLKIMEKLRDPESGCPWDVRQTYKTIVPHTLEEVYEVIDAIENGEVADLREELGDLLFQIVFYAQIGKERNDFDFDDVVNSISDKLIRRHPHVFDRNNTNQSLNENELSTSWDAIKKDERQQKLDNGNDQSQDMQSQMDNIPLVLPALTRGAKIQNRAAKVGFDWQTVEPVWEKLKEEVAEIHEAINENLGQDKIEDEVGDLLCVCVNLARHLKVDPEQALRRSNSKFERRFRYIESCLMLKNKTAEEASLEEMDALWEEAKKHE